MPSHAYHHAPYMRRIREEFDVVLSGTTQVNLADICGVTQSTICRRWDNADRFHAYPMEDVLKIAFELRKAFPGLPWAISQFFNRDMNETRSLSATDRAFEANEQLLDAMREVQEAMRDGKFTKQEVVGLRQQWARTITAMSRLLEAAEIEAQGSPA